MLLKINNDSHTYNVTNCSYDGRYYECFIEVNLSEFEGQEITYWFNVSDFVNTVNSKASTIKVDTLAPEMEIISPENNESYERRINFEIGINETNLRYVSYVYEYKGRQREILLCTRLDSNGMCKKIKSFVPGDYTITIIAEDKAGNAVGMPVEFEVE